MQRPHARLASAIMLDNTPPRPPPAHGIPINKNQGRVNQSEHVALQLVNAAKLLMRGKITLSICFAWELAELCDGKKPVHDHCIFTRQLTLSRTKIVHPGKELCAAVP